MAGLFRRPLRRPVRLPGSRPGFWTPADLPAGVLLYWSGRTLASVAAATDGTGSVDGLTDSSTAAYLADYSPSGIPLVQATSGSRPIVGYSAKGRGLALLPDSARSLAGGSSLAGGRYTFAAVTPVGTDGAAITTELPAVFASESMALIAKGGATADTHSLLIGLAGGNAWWTSGGLSGPAYRDGTNTLDVGRWYKRRVFRFDRSSDAATGALLLLRDHGSVIPSRSWLHEVVILDDSASAADLAAVALYFEWHRATPTVVCTADSLMAGYGLSPYNSVPHKLARSRWRGCVSVPNIGVTGQTTTTAISGDPAKLDSLAGTGKNIVVLESGSNDIVGGASAATVWASIQSYITMATERGWQVVVCSVPQGSYWTGLGKAALVSDLRDLIEDGWEAAGAAGFADLWTAAPSQSDGLHFDAAGTTTAADCVGVVVDTLL